MSFDLSRASEVLQALADATGYLWRIDYDKKLRMWLPGRPGGAVRHRPVRRPAPKWVGDVEVETILGDNYANRVTVICAPVEEEAHVETFTGDGSTSVFSLEWTLLAHRGYVTDDLAADAGRQPDPDDDRLPRDGVLHVRPDREHAHARAGPLPLGQIASITFKGTFSATAVAEDAGEIAAHGLYEHVERRSDITTAAAAQDLADAILAQLLNSGEQVISYETRYAAPTLRAGQQQTVTPRLATCRATLSSATFASAPRCPRTATGWLTPHRDGEAHATARREVAAHVPRLVEGRERRHGRGDGAWPDGIHRGGAAGYLGAVQPRRAVRRRRLHV
jgi:hypothetical protein